MNPRDVAAPMNRGDVAVWSALFALGVAFEFRELREGPNGVPLSRLLRSVFRTEHPAGAALFRASLTVGSVVLARHICTQPAPQPAPPQHQEVE